MAYWVEQIAAIVAPDDAALQTRAKAIAADILATSNEAQSSLNSDQTYLVQHDAIQYLEQQWGLAVIGALATTDDEMPSAQRVGASRDLLAEFDNVCVVTEVATFNRCKERWEFPSDKSQLLICWVLTIRVPTTIGCPQRRRQ